MRNKMRPQEVIARKRDGGSLTEKQITSFIDGVCDGHWADYQISALLMAMFVCGLNGGEQDLLTRAMLHSGEVLDLSDIAKPKADKHSTGGVGDKTSLIIAPIAAACGVAVPMISGRGLGHTGGTLDKLESIPGYNVNVSTDEFRRIIKRCGFAMSGQTADIAPADKKLYALRDATATVPYIPLIVGSIMSKKLAEGLDALVLDVKTGSGAFMRRLEDSKKLAEALVATGRNFGVKTEAVVSDMSQPLGKYAGNGHEVFECIKILRDEAEPAMGPTRELSIELTARMLVLSGIEKDIEAAKAAAVAKIASGEALECFRQNVEMQGGDVRVCDRPEILLARGLFECVIEAPASGFVAEINTFSIGNAMVEVGGGRTKAEDGIDHEVGFEALAAIGQEVREGDPLCIAFCRNETQGGKIRKKLTDAYTISGESVLRPSLVREVVK